MGDVALQAAALAINELRGLLAGNISVVVACRQRLLAKMSGGHTISVQNTLRKLGADLRWFVEKNGIDPSKVQMLLAVESVADRDRLLAGLDREFDQSSMKRWANSPYQMMVHGIGIAVVVKEPA